MISISYCYNKYRDCFLRKEKCLTHVTYAFSIAISENFTTILDEIVSVLGVKLLRFLGMTQCFDTPLYPINLSEV